MTSAFDGHMEISFITDTCDRRFRKRLEKEFADIQGLDVCGKIIDVKLSVTTDNFNAVILWELGSYESRNKDD